MFEKNLKIQIFTLQIHGKNNSNFTDRMILRVDY